MNSEAATQCSLKIPTPWQAGQFWLLSPELEVIGGAKNTSPVPPQVPQASATLTTGKLPMVTEERYTFLLRFCILSRCRANNSLPDGALPAPIPLSEVWR